MSHRQCSHCRSFSRREFLGVAALGAAAAGSFSIPRLGAKENPLWDPKQPMKRIGTPLVVQPILLYGLSKRREATSWRPWGGLHTEDDVNAEAQRIARDWNALSARAEFPLEIRPLVKVRNTEDAANVRDTSGYDVPVVFAASGGTGALEACFSDRRNNLIFLRHTSGPVYLWYEITHNRFLRQGRVALELDEYRYPSGMTVDDVVVDSWDEMLVKLRALFGVKNFVGKSIVALGGSQGWCCPPAPGISREKFKLNIVDTGYDDLARRIQYAKAERRRTDEAAAAAEAYLDLKGTRLETDKRFLVNAFLLYGLFKDIMRDHGTDAFTINECMSTVIPMSETTACMPLSLLNDDGDMAFCESDFNVIPSGILLRYVCGRPVFLNDPTYPHAGMVTVAHCTAPRRMDGRKHDPARILTHFESDYGAAPKVELKKNTAVTMVCPDAGQKKWVGFTGTVERSPFYDICRSQYDVRIRGDWEKLLQDHRGFHWMMAVGDYSKEMAYAAPKVGIEWEGIS